MRQSILERTLSIRERFLRTGPLVALLALGAVVRAQETPSTMSDTMPDDWPAVVGGTWSGRIIDVQDGSPVMDLLVRLLDLNKNELMRTVTRTDGRFSFPARRGAGVVQACVPGGTTLEKVVVGRSSLRDRRVPEMRIDSRAEFPVFAIARDAGTGLPLSGAQVVVSSADNSTVLFEMTTDSTGTVKGAVRNMRFGNAHDVQVIINKSGAFRKMVLMRPEELAFSQWDLAGSEGPVLHPIVLSEDVRMQPVHPPAKSVVGKHPAHPPN